MWLLLGAPFWVGSPKRYTKLKGLARDKHSSLLEKFVKSDRKMFCNIGPGHSLNSLELNMGNLHQIVKFIQKNVKHSLTLTGVCVAELLYGYKIFQNVVSQSVCLCQSLPPYSNIYI